MLLKTLDRVRLVATARFEAILVACEPVQIVRRERDTMLVHFQLFGSTGRAPPLLLLLLTLPAPAAPTPPRPPPRPPPP